MRLIGLRRKIIINFILLALISILLGVGIFYNFYTRTRVDEKVQKIKMDTLRIKGQGAELESKTIEIRKYTDLYNRLSENKKSVGGIKMDDINERLKVIADKYSIMDATIKVTLPETLKGGIFERNTISVLLATTNINFIAVSDVKALGFISEFMESIPGYAVITNVEIKKGKPYTTQELIDLSTGKGKGAVTGKVDFFWYVSKAKDEPKKDEKKEGEQ
jgi:hypothetical protein